MRTIFLIFLSVNLLLETANFYTVRNIANRSVYPAREYQIELEPDSTYVYSDGLLIGTVKSWQQGTIESVIWFSKKGQRTAGYK